MANVEPKPVITSDVKDHYDSQIKSANYLLVAHGAGLVGCLSVLKDYATTPQLKGLGFFVVVFGIGLLGAILNYVSIAFGIQFATSRMHIKSKSGYVSAISMTLLGAAGGITSLVMLVIAIVAIIARFGSL